MEYARVGVLLVSHVPVGAAAGAGVEVGAVGARPLQLELLPVSLRLTVHGAGVAAGVATARDGTVLPG